MKAIVLVFILLIVVQSRDYVLYKQCEGRWASIKMGTSSQTICMYGSLITSVAMILKTYNITVNGQDTTPGTLNTWLNNNGGYAGSDLYVWASVSKLGLPWYSVVHRNDIFANFNAGKHCILNVRNGGHWVLMTGESGGQGLVVTVNDPGYAIKAYALDDVGAVGVYNPIRLTLLQEMLQGVN